MDYVVCLIMLWEFNSFSLCLIPDPIYPFSLIFLFNFFLSHFDHAGSDFEPKLSASTLIPLYFPFTKPEIGTVKWKNSHASTAEYFSFLETKSSNIVHAKNAKKQEELLGKEIKWKQTLNIVPVKNQAMKIG